MNYTCKMVMFPQYKHLQLAINTGKIIGEDIGIVECISFRSTVERRKSGI